MNLPDVSGENWNEAGIAPLYATAIPAKRTGPLYMACSYPTKISPEAIAVFLASHTKPGDTVLDVFAGSGTTGMAAHLCARPTPEVIELANRMQVPVSWGPRNVVLQELGVWGSFIARVMCDPPDPEGFQEAARRLIAKAEADNPNLYAVQSADGAAGALRYAIWSDVVTCPHCAAETALWDAAVRFAPLRLESSFKCPTCHLESKIDEAERTVEPYQDRLINAPAVRRKRVLRRIYGRSEHGTWWRDATAADQEAAAVNSEMMPPSTVPIVQIPWGDLHRAGYHRGITHAHHFYTSRNLRSISALWEAVDDAPAEFHDALKLLILSYNATHSTLMTRVVVKQGMRDFVVTGAQSGVLYVSGLPVEKNVFEGVRGKVKTFTNAFRLVHGSTSSVRVNHGSSTQLPLPDRSVDYVFTDPPFGDYIPYAEVNFLNEAWLGATTDSREEVVVSRAQNKSVADYETLMASVFSEVARVLKDDGKATVVFHSAKASVWRALQSAYASAGFQVRCSGVLDKLQTSFKQTNSTISVQGDPLLLLTKQSADVRQSAPDGDPRAVMRRLWTQAQANEDLKERTPERLYSRFVAQYLQRDLPVPLDAGRFYAQLTELQRGLP